MQLKTYLIYCLILYLVLVIRTLLYIEKEKTRRAEKGDRRNRKRENQGEGCRRPIASSSPLLLLRLMSSPSTPSTAAHTSPHHVEPSPKGRAATSSTSGRCYLHHITTPRCRPLARSSPLLLLRLMSSPSTPSTAAHHLASLCQQSGRGKGGNPVRLWVIPSRPHRHNLSTDRPAIRRSAPLAVCHPAPLVLFPVLFSSIRW